jgi:hypothetical protein
MIIKWWLFVNKEEEEEEEETERKILDQIFIACPLSEANIRLW